MRTLVLVVALAGCHGASSSGPAWPKSAGTVAPDGYEDDGGESLAPHPRHVAAIEVATDDSPAASAAGAASTTVIVVEPGTTTVPAPAPVPPTETIELQVEDIQIGPGGVIIITP